MVKFVTPYTFKEEAHHLENPSGSSLTVPEQSLTINQIMSRFASGIAPDIVKQGYYSEDENLNFEDYDETRNLDFDLVDYTLELHNTNEKHAELQRVKESLEKLSKKEPKKEIVEEEASE